LSTRIQGSSAVSPEEGRNRWVGGSLGDFEGSLGAFERSVGLLKGPLGSTQRAIIGRQRVFVGGWLGILAGGHFNSHRRAWYRVSGAMKGKKQKQTD
jgi:hypothetical protein